jgi:lactate dehydrogenase-like 2-hydroxyacid dehydrogenase
MVMRIVDLIAGLDWSESELAQFRALGEYIQAPTIPTTEAELIAWVRDADYAILEPLPEGRVSRRVFEQASKLKGISLVTTWFHWIDTPAAKEKGIVVSNLGKYSTASVAEMALALILALARKITISSNSTKAGSREYEEFMGFELKDKILGVIGMGSIGTYIAKLGQGIGMNVIGYNRTFRESSVPLVPIEQLLRQADVISMSLALNEHTENFLNADKLSLIKPTAIVVNISREGLIDQEAMYHLLVTNQIGGYAFELDEPKKYPVHQELLRLDNVIATPYIAWYTPEAFQRLKQVTLANIRAMIEGKPINTV